MLRVMRKLIALLVALVATTALVAGCSTASASADLDGAAFAEQVATPGVITLDVRTPGEFAAGHIPGAVNIDVESGTFEQDIAALDPGATYAVYCRSGRRSAVAIGIMEGAGFTSMSNLAGGISAWPGELVTGP